MTERAILNSLQRAKLSSGRVNREVTNFIAFCKREGFEQELNDG